MFSNQQSLLFSNQSLVFSNQQSLLFRNKQSLQFSNQSLLFSNQSLLFRPVTLVQQPVTPVQQPAFTHVQQPVFAPGPFIYQPVIAPSTTPPLSHSPPPLPPPICNLQPTVQVSQSPKLQKELLLDPDVVVRKYPKYRNVSQAGRLAVRLAVESYFGTEMLRQSTVCGLKSHKPLPVEKVNALKQKMLTLHSDNKVEFEALWTKCINAINHHAIGLRKKSLMH